MIFTRFAQFHTTRMLAYDSIRINNKAQKVEFLVQGVVVASREAVRLEADDSMTLFISGMINVDAEELTNSLMGQDNAT